MDRRQLSDLDSWITGHGGEDSVPPDDACLRCGGRIDPSGDDWVQRDMPGQLPEVLCPACAEVASGRPAKGRRDEQ